MTTPAQYEAASRALENFIVIATQEGAVDGVLAGWFPLPPSDIPALESALAIVREAREREVAHRNLLTMFEEECYHRLAADARVGELERQVAGLPREPLTIRVVGEDCPPITPEVPDAR